MRRDSWGRKRGPLAQKRERGEGVKNGWRGGGHHHRRSR